MVSTVMKRVQSDTRPGATVVAKYASIINGHAPSPVLRAGQESDFMNVSRYDLQPFMNINRAGLERPASPIGEADTTHGSPRNG